MLDRCESCCLKPSRCVITKHSDDYEICIEYGEAIVTCITDPSDKNENRLHPSIATKCTKDLNDLPSLSRPIILNWGNFYSLKSPRTRNTSNKSSLAYSFSPLLQWSGKVQLCSPLERVPSHLLGSPFRFLSPSFYPSIFPTLPAFSLFNAQCSLMYRKGTGKWRLTIDESPTVAGGCKQLFAVSTELDTYLHTRWFNVTWNLIVRDKRYTWHPYI